MIVITGAAGFIGSVLVARLNSDGYKNLILVDDFNKISKNKNLDQKYYIKKFTEMIFFSGLMIIFLMLILYFILALALIQRSLIVKFLTFSTLNIQNRFGSVAVTTKFH